MKNIKKDPEQLSATQVTSTTDEPSVNGAASEDETSSIQIIDVEMKPADSSVKSDHSIKSGSESAGPSTKDNVKKPKQNHSKSGSESPGPSTKDNVNKPKRKSTHESDDEFVELSTKTSVKKSQLSAHEIETLIVKCTACRTQINHRDSDRVKRHPHLKVLICKDCLDFYSGGEFSQDEDGDKYCRWCAQGGHLFGCDSCTNVFCIKCIRYNFGRSEVSNIQTSSTWKCYVCDPKSLEGKINFCNSLYEFSKGILGSSKRKSSRKNLVRLNLDKESECFPQEWLSKSVENAIIISKDFQKKMEKLKEIISQPKSKTSKQLLKKMEQVSNDLRSLVKYNTSNANKKYRVYLKHKMKVASTSNSDDKKELNIRQSVSNTVDNMLNELSSDKNLSPLLSDENGELNQTPRANENGELNQTPRANENGELNQTPRANENNDLKQTLQTNKTDKVNQTLKSKKKLVPEGAEVDNPVKIEIDSNADFFCSKTPSSETKPIELADNKSDDEVILVKSSASDFSLSGTSSEKSSTKNKKSFTKNKKPLKNYDSSSSSDSHSISSSVDSKFKGITKAGIRKKKFLFTKEEVAQWNENKVTILKNDTKLSKQPVTLLKKLNVPKEKCDDALRYFKEKRKKGDDLTNMEKSVNRLLDDKKRKRRASSNEETVKPKAKKVKKEKENKEEIENYSSSASGDFSLEASDSEKKDIFASIFKNEIPPSANDQSSEDLSDRDVDILFEKQQKASKKGKSSSKIESSSTSSEEDKSIIVSDSDSKSSDDDFVIKRSKKDQKLIDKANNLMKGDSKKNKKDKDNEKSKGKKGKQKRRKIIYSDDSDIKSDDSDSSSESNSSDSDFQQKKKKAQKRKRVTLDSSDESSREANTESTPGKGRKNIRKVISEKSLDEETREAQLLEKERKKRLLERQKLYNKIFDNQMPDKNTVTKKLVLEIDSETKKELVEIHPDIVQKLKPHQINGVKFMWEATIESVKELKKENSGSGCILAHCMGLGKTLQVIAFLFTILTNKIIKKKIRTAMVVCPNNTVINWANEFDKWLEDCEDANQINIFEMIHVKDYSSRLTLLQNWQKDGGVLIIGYEIFARLVDRKIPKKTKVFKDKVFTNIADPGPDIIICDEGHKLKNENSQLARSANKIRTARRIILTGTPLQNNLKEYYCMMNFVKPHLLGTFKEFTNRFVNPISNGQYDNSSKHDVKLMKKRIHILQKLLEGCVQRCDYSALTKFLPPKHEFVISVKLSEVQIKLYKAYLDRNLNYKLEDGEQKLDGQRLFPDYCCLRYIWTFPHALRLNQEKREQKALLKDEDVDDEGNLKDFIDDSSSSGESSASSKSDLEIIDEPVAGPSKKTRGRRKKKKEGDSSEDEVIKAYPRGRASDAESEEESQTTKQWYDEYFSDEDRLKAELGGKIVLMLEILKACENIGDKVLLFSTSIITLNIIEMFLEDIHQKTQNKQNDVDCDIRQTWVRGVDYFRMDGQTKVELRQKYMSQFNRIENIRGRLFLISTKAGSLGTNLTGANRVILFDASWNPSDDVQSIFRVYRFGQSKPVYIYRFLAQGTMEEKIYNRQVAKLSMSCRVVDEQNIERHFNASDLTELYKFEPDLNTEHETLMVPNDRLLADLIMSHRDWIIKYFEHDSLLQCTPEEDLTEEERQTAWTEYENEKEGLYTPQSDNVNFSTTNTGFNYAFDMNTIVKQIIEDVDRKFPGISRYEQLQKISAPVFAMKAKCQTDLTYCLRRKQDLYSKGMPIPPEINVTIDRVMKNMNEIDRISNNIRAEMNREVNNKMKQPAGARMPNQTYVRMTGRPAAGRNMPTNPGMRFFFTRPPQQNTFQPKTPLQGRIIDITDDDSGGVKSIPVIDVEPVVTFSEESEKQEETPKPKPVQTVEIMEVE